MKVDYSNLLVRFKKMVGQMAALPSRDYIINSFGKKGIEVSVKTVNQLLNDYKAWKSPVSRPKAEKTTGKRGKRGKKAESTRRTSSRRGRRSSGENQATDTAPAPSAPRMPSPTMADSQGSSQPPVTPPAPPTPEPTQTRSYGAMPKETRRYGKR